MKRRRECVFRGELDMLTLVWTRGRAFPLGMLKAGCAVSGADHGGFRVAFIVPSTPAAKAL